MPRIRCHLTDCVFVDDGLLPPPAVELDPIPVAATYSPNEEAVAKGEDWKKRNWKNGRKKNWTKRKMRTGRRRDEI